MYKKEDSLSIDLHFERVLTPCHNVVTKMSLVDILKSLSKLSHELKDVSNKSLPPYTFIFILNPFVTLLPYRFSPPPSLSHYLSNFVKERQLLQTLFRFIVEPPLLPLFYSYQFGFLLHHI